MDFNLIRIVLPIIIIFIVFIVLYSVAPNVKTKLKSVLPGAVFTSIIWLAGSFGFGWYISNFGNYSKTYGSIAGIIILLLWLYITSFIIIVGAEINAIIHQHSVIKGKTPEEAALEHDDNNKIIIMRTLGTNMMKILMQHINVRIMLMNILVIPIQKMIKV